MILLVTFLVATATALPPQPHYNLGEIDNLFKEFVHKYGKVYNAEEYLTRLEIFKQNLERINERNEKYPHEVGINRFTDLTLEERQNVGTKQLDAARQSRAVSLEYPAEAITAPDTFDWRDHGVVTHVKDQLHCQSSWVFSATGNIEGQYALKYKKLIAFSEQAGIDCGKIVGACMGGRPDELMVFYYTNIFDKTRGVVSEKDYPYTGSPTPFTHDHSKQCPSFNTTLTHYTGVLDYQIFAPKDEETLKQLLYETGPLAVGLDMSSIYEYTKGIWDPCECDMEPNQYALLVGYGIENETKFWTLKNSWGESWGEKGYFRLIRGKQACSMGLSYAATCTVL